MQGVWLSFISFAHHAASDLLAGLRRLDNTAFQGFLAFLKHTFNFGSLCRLHFSVFASSHAVCVCVCVCATLEVVQVSVVWQCSG